MNILTDNTLFWLVLANGIAWLGIGGYIAFMARSQRLFARRLNQLEKIKDDNGI